MRPSVRILSFVVVPVAVACQPGDVGTTGQILCGLSASPTARWPTHDEGLFELRVPENFGEPVRRGFDSYSASWESQLGRITYEWGPYPNDLASLDEDAEVTTTICDPSPLGADGLIHMETDSGAHYLAARWSGLPGAISLDGDELVVVIELEDPGRLPQGLGILATVRIRDLQRRRLWPGELGIVVCSGGSPDDCEFIPSEPDGDPGR